jgi:phosphoribosylformimino-5-aminoimidazole carboxamide ribotide isomerase
LRSLARRWPGRVNLGLDVSGGLVAVRGWTEASRLTALELLSRLEGAPLGEVIHTDVSRDGTLAGPDLESLVALAGRSPWPVIASGGVASVEDLERLAALGVFGAIVGRALYTGEVDLADAISRIEGRPAPPSE